jgi:hypothetical protein
VVADRDHQSLNGMYGGGTFAPVRTSSRVLAPEILIAKKGTDDRDLA